MGRLVGRLVGLVGLGLVRLGLVGLVMKTGMKFQNYGTPPQAHKITISIYNQHRYAEIYVAKL